MRALSNEIVWVVPRKQKECRCRAQRFRPQLCQAKGTGRRNGEPDSTKVGPQVKPLLSEARRIGDINRRNQQLCAVEAERLSRGTQPRSQIGSQARLREALADTYTGLLVIPVAMSLLTWTAETSELDISGRSATLR